MSATDELTAEAAFLPTHERTAGQRWARQLAARLGAVALCALPGMLTLYLSFNSGGYFAGSQGVVVVALAVVVAARVLLIRAPFACVTRSSAVVLGALALYAVWSLLSAHWSRSPSRAVLGFNLSCLYLLAGFLSASTHRSQRRVRWTLGFTWAAMLAVCCASVATRLRPDLFPIPVDMSANRLSFPLTYWNALGLFATIGLVLTLNLAGSARGPFALRILATAASPIFAVTMLLTYSRAAMLLGAFGVLAYVVLARSPGLVGTLIAAVPASAVAVLSTYHAKLISNALTSEAAVAQGRHLVSVIALACLVAAGLRLAAVGLDARSYRVGLFPKSARSRWVLAIACAGAVALLAIGFSGRITTQVNNFVKQDTATGSSDVRNRLGSIRIGGRLGGWRLAWKMFEANPTQGAGANTFALYWDSERGSPATALQAHSLYLQALSELGVIGFAAILVAIVSILAAAWARRRRAQRSLWSAVVVVGALWAVHVGVDWDWQMPAVTLPVIALGAAALSRRGDAAVIPTWVEMPLRAGAALVALALALVGLHIAASDARLSASVTDFNRGDCPAAMSDADASISALPSRPQPYAIQGYCEILTGAPAAAESRMQDAVNRDPQNWRYHYGLAVSEAAAGRDPSAQLQEAAQLDPLESMIVTAKATLSGRHPGEWKAAVRTLPMPVSMRE